MGEMGGLATAHPHRALAALPLCTQAIDLIDEATARVKMEKTLKPEVGGGDELGEDA